MYIEQLPNGTYALCHGDGAVIAEFASLEEAVRRLLWSRWVEQSK